MNDGKQNLATAVRDARTKLGLSQEKLATELWHIIILKYVPEQKICSLIYTEIFHYFFMIFSPCTVTNILVIGV